MASNRYFCSDTAGQWRTEDASKRALRQLLDATDAFDAYEECRCEPIAHRPRADAKEFLRVDFVLVPKDSLRRAGWDSVIAVEAKKSGHKATGFIGQLIDYSWCKVRPSAAKPGWWLMPDLFAIWPYEGPITGPVLSVMTSHSIGALMANRRGGLDLRYPCDMYALRLYPGEPPIVRDVSAIGHKEGSR